MGEIEKVSSLEDTLGEQAYDELGEDQPDAALPQETFDE